MKVLLLSTYDLGHQPFGLASPAAWLRNAGAEVAVNDIAVEALDEDAVRAAAMICVHLPMHTATRLAVSIVPRLRAINADAHLVFFGLYAPLNREILQDLDAAAIVGGEFEAEIVETYRRLARGENGAAVAIVSTAKQEFHIPDRAGLPALETYAHLDMGDGTERVAGYTEASRGCKHLCWHCPVVPVYNGRFRVVDVDTVLADIRNQVAAGAAHITFGDPDFFNGPAHGLAIVRALHEEFPEHSYDVTIKIEHLIDHARHLPVLAETGCLFVTSAVESVDDEILALLDKGHTRTDFVRAVELCRSAGLTLSPTFIPFTPWTTAERYRDILALIAELGLVDHVSPVQLAIRLLVPRFSRLLELDEMQARLGPFDQAALSYRWTSADPVADVLAVHAMEIVEHGAEEGAGRAAIFEKLWAMVDRTCALRRPLPPLRPSPAPVPRMSEPWYCCAEPTGDQFARVA